MSMQLGYGDHDSTPLFLVAPTTLATVVQCQTAIRSQLLLCYSVVLVGLWRPSNPRAPAPIGPIELMALGQACQEVAYYNPILTLYFPIAGIGVPVLVKVMVRLAPTR